MKRFRWHLALVALSLFMACGGGGAKNSVTPSPDPVGSPTPVPTPTPTPTAIPTPTPISSPTPTPTPSTTPTPTPTSTAVPTPTPVGSLTLSYVANPLFKVGTAIAKQNPTVGNETTGVVSTFQVLDGALPSGIALNPDGSYSGTPRCPGVFTFRIQVANGNRTAATIVTATAEAQGSLSVSYSLPAAAVGSSTSIPVPFVEAATPGLATHFAVNSGTLPGGLKLNDDGSITGTPSGSGVFTFTLLITNGTRTSTKDMAITIHPAGALSLGYPDLPRQLLGRAIPALTPVVGNATSGAATAFAITGGALPGGLTLNANTGVITGIPTAVGAFNVEISLTSGNRSATATLVGRVGTRLGVDDVIAVPDVDEFRLANSVMDYYVDSINGNDTADGRSADRPWKRLAKINALTLQPGTVIHLARGSVWKESLRFKNSGTSAAPIVVQAYGSGEAPTIQLFTGDTDATNGVWVSASYIHILDLRLSDIHWSAIHLEKASQYVVIAGNEILRCGAGIDLLGKHQKALSNYIHDMTLVVDTGDPNTAWGANGIGVQGEDLEVAWNRMVNCRAQCKNFGGWDGGAIEYFGNDVGGVGWNHVSDNVRIHHNLVDHCDGFLEAAGRITNLVFSHNLAINMPSVIFLFHMGTNAGIKPSYQARLENNTVVGPLTPFSFYNSVGYQSGNSVTIRNNIAVAQGQLVWGFTALGNDLVHDHNLFYFLPGGYLGYGPSNLWSLGTAESVIDWTAVTAPHIGFEDFNNQDYRLGSASPARLTGAASGDSVDLLGATVPTTSAADIGAYQYR